MELSTKSQSRSHAASSAWAPLHEPLFRGLWIASFISYIGSWMQNVNTGWLMTSLTGSPMMVSLVQVAMSLPVFLVVLPAGALADTMDRRRLLLVTQSWMVLAAAALGVVTLFGMVTPWLLLAFTSLLGLGAVMNDPAWQAITPETVCGEHFPAAVALNSAAYNVARAIGPAAGGLVIVLAGSGAAFLLNAASFFGVILFLFRWKRPAQSVPHPRQRVVAAIGSGFKFVAGSHAMQAALLRTGLFSFCASALWALVPLIARPHGSVGYGIVLGFFGLGALLLAAIMPWLRQKNSVDMIVGGATVLFAGATFVLGQVQPFWMLCVAMLLAGMGWIAVLATLNVAVQTIAVHQMRARALAMYVLVLQGGMSAGAAFWGAVASWRGIGTSLGWAALGLSLGLAAIPSNRLRVELPGWTTPVST
jgi:MFS family permease